MANAKLLFGLGGFIAGTVIGAGVTALRDELGFSNLQRAIPGQSSVNRRLDQLLAEARQAGALKLRPGDRYVIFSDQHKGAHNRADDFEQCEDTYITALDHYDRLGWNLVLLGDCEDFLEESVPAVMRAYSNIFQLLARFYPDRLVKIYGNHDIVWRSKMLVRTYLDPYMPGIQVQPCLLLQYQDGPQASGEIFLAHGHQGTLSSDALALLGRLTLPWYRRLQNRIGIGGTYPSEDVCLRSQQDNRMYTWASRKNKLILIAGHTHRPVWSSVTHLEKLVWQLHDLRTTQPERQPANYQQQVDLLTGKVEQLRVASPPCLDVVKTRPAYFNTGCCCFKDGDITGIEIEDGCLRLIKWDGDTKQREVLEDRRLSEIFFDL